jgi:hypothetical protein
MLPSVAYNTRESELAEIMGTTQWFAFFFFSVLCRINSIWSRLAEDLIVPEDIVVTKLQYCRDMPRKTGQRYFFLPTMEPLLERYCRYTVELANFEGL